MTIDRINPTGDDGEFLSAFREPTDNSLAQDVNQGFQLFEQTRNEKEKILLGLMKRWEGKKPSKGFVKEYFTIGKGKDRTVICVNPYIDDDSIVFLGLCKETFFRLNFNKYADDVKEHVDYVSSPFITADQSFDNGPLVFFSALRGQFPGKSVKWIRTRRSENRTVVIENTDGKPFGKGIFQYIVSPIGIDEAGDLFQGIQSRVAEECASKLEQLNALVAANKNTGIEIENNFGDLKKKKNEEM